jgi:uncharacterized membrane protein (GlpM family)
MSASVDTNDLPFGVGAVAGAVAWLLGYVVTYLIAATDLEDSPLNRIVEAFEGESATYELVGWVFYNAHFVDISYQNVGFFQPPASFIGGDNGFTAALYVLPPAFLFIAGLAITRYQGIDDLSDGAVAGALVVPGYLVVSVLGAFLFEVTLGDAAGAPDLLPAIVIAGILSPVVFGAIGGAVGGRTAE